MKRSVCIVLAFATLAGCAGQASPYTMQMLANAQFACAQGDQGQCGNVPLLQYQAALEAQQNAQANSAAAAVGLAVLGGVALGAAASNGGGGYYGRHH